MMGKKYKGVHLKNGEMNRVPGKHGKAHQYYLYSCYARIFSYNVNEIVKAIIIMYAYIHSKLHKYHTHPFISSR